ncbi:MAG: hypothetical protein ABSH38_01445 [Verrucomicrobiota bacterium]|jgi:hypothetical protein
MNVLVIPEDFRKDQFILQPIIAAMFAKLGKPANVRVLTDPLIGGIVQALNRQLLRQVVEDNKWHVDLFLLCVDRDGESDRRQALDGLEQHLNTLLGAPKFMIAENAWQELEVWVLAGHDLPPDWSWQEIRNEHNPKEKYFEKLVATRRLQNDPGGGRKTLGYEAAKRYRQIFSKCREDIQVLEGRIAHGSYLPWRESA